MSVPALEMKVFEPLSVQPRSVRAAAVRIPAASQPALALLGAAEQQQRQRADGQVRLPGGGDRLVDLADLEQRGDEADRRQPDTAVLGRDEQAHEVELAHPAQQLGRAALLVPPGRCVRRDLPLGEVAAQVADRGLVGGELVGGGEVGHASSPPST
jgi:hypothetical protein